MEFGGQLFDGEAFGGVMAGDGDGDLFVTGFQSGMEADFAGDESIAAGGDRIAEKITGSAAANGDSRNFSGSAVDRMQAIDREECGGAAQKCID